MSDDSDDDVGFFFYKDIPKKKLFGYDNQKLAGIGACVSVVEGGASDILTFGYPGTGKSDFPFVLAHLVEEKLKARFSLTLVKCDRFAGKVTNETVERIMQKIDKALKNPPTIIAFDEIDALSLPIDQVPASLE